MEKSIIRVDGMSCEHCVKAVTDAVIVLSGVDGVAVDLGDGIVTVDYDPAVLTLDTIKSEIEDQGFDIAE